MKVSVEKEIKELKSRIKHLEKIIDILLEYVIEYLGEKLKRL